MLNAQCSMTQRCTNVDTKNEGCVRAAGHTGRHKIRDNPDSIFGGAKTAPKLSSALKARKRQFLKAADETAANPADDKSGRIAALCEIATALGMVRIVTGDSMAWVNPTNGLAAVLDESNMDVHTATISPDGPISPASPPALMNILGVPGLTLADGGVLYASGGKLIVQTPSGGLRPARLEMDPAMGPAGDGEGR